MYSTYGIVKLFASSQDPHQVFGAAAPPWKLKSMSVLLEITLDLHEGYRNTIELLDGNNVVPLRSDTIQLVQNGCSFHGLRMAEMFGLLRELTSSRTPKKVFVREKARHPVIKHVNSISLIKIKEEKSIKNKEVVNKNIVQLVKSNIVEPIEEVDEKEEVEYRTNDEPEEAENDVDLVTLTSIVSKLILEWEERIKFHQEKEMESNQWRSRVFNVKHSTFVKEGYEVSWILEGDAKKEKSNESDSFGPGLDFASTSLLDATGTIHIGTGSINNSGNGDGDSENAGHTCPNLASDGVVASPHISTPNPGKSSSYDNDTSKPSMMKVNFRTLFTTVGNKIDVVVPVESIRAISERFANIAYGVFLRKQVAYPIVANYVRNTWGVDAMLKNGLWFIRNNLLILKKWHPNVNLLKEDVGNIPSWVKLHGVLITTFNNIVVVMPKITKEGFYTCNIHVEYEWKPPRKLIANTSETKKKNMNPTKEVSMSNPFDVLTSIENDVDLGANRGTSNLASQVAISSGSSFWNVNSSSPGTTLIIEKIDKIKKLIIDRKVTLVDDEGKPLEKVVSLGDYDSLDDDYGLGKQALNDDEDY
nr:hypothetical protein [Tanacetum cinerariifolium]